jgi:hypothetical protein
VLACGGAPGPESMPVRAYPESGVAEHPDSALRRELLAMGVEDQAVRAGLTPETFADTAFVGRMMRTDSALSIRLREIIDERGWPDAERVGADAVDAAFLIVQHSPFPDMLVDALPFVEADVRAGRLDAQAYAMLVDRVRDQSGQKQLYGSQYELIDGVMVRKPVEDPANLDRRRAELGLVPIAEYERLLGELYQVEVRSE